MFDGRNLRITQSRWICSDSRTGIMYGVDVNSGPRPETDSCLDPVSVGTGQAIFVRKGGVIASDLRRVDSSAVTLNMESADIVRCHLFRRRPTRAMVSIQEPDNVRVIQRGQRPVSVPWSEIEPDPHPRLGPISVSISLERRHENRVKIGNRYPARLVVSLWC
jgi:hypothetical protein